MKMVAMEMLTSENQMKIGAGRCDDCQAIHVGLIVQPGSALPVLDGRIVINVELSPAAARSFAHRILEVLDKPQ